MIYKVLAPSQVVGLGISEPSTVFDHLDFRETKKVFISPDHKAGHLIGGVGEVMGG